ncbi:MAG: hypothetical protein PVSMB1_07930 [Gemmatimonadaceae bacterium]
MTMVVADHLRRATRLYTSNIAAICGTEQRSYAEMDDRSNRLANALLSRGLRSGDRVVILLENSIRCIEVDFALAKTGLVRVALNARVTAAELAYVIRDAGPSAIVIGSKFTHVLSETGTDLGALQYIVCVAEPGQTIRYEAALDYETLLGSALADPLDASIGEEDLHSIAYTSGSTGKPKGVMLTLRGCTAVLMQQFDAQTALVLMRDLEIETVKLVPTMLHRMLASAETGQWVWPRLRQIVYAGSHIAGDVLKRAIQCFGPRLAQHYGQTEAPSTLTVLPSRSFRFCTDFGAMTCISSL